MKAGLITSGTDLRTVSAKLRRAGDGRLKKKFRTELRACVAPMVPAVRASIAAIPVKGPDSSGLRTRMQRATRLSVKTTGRSAGVAILVDPKRMPDGQKALPQYMEGAEGHTRWRHPVFGDPDAWVTQEPHAYFFPIVRRLGVTSRIAVDKVIADINRQLS